MTSELPADDPAPVKIFLTCLSVLQCLLVLAFETEISMRYGQIKITVFSSRGVCLSICLGVPIPNSSILTSQYRSKQIRVQYDDASVVMLPLETSKSKTTLKFVEKITIMSDDAIQMQVYILVVFAVGRRQRTQGDPFQSTN